MSKANASPVPKSKILQYAELVALFDNLASRQPRPSPATTSKVIEDLENTIISKDLQPVLRNLASLVDARRTKAGIVGFGGIEGKKAGTGGRPRRNTVAAPTLPFNNSTNAPSFLATATFLTKACESDESSTPSFPLGQNAEFPFTFKLMLHKLYELEEWGQKVRDVLEKSQTEFKPLSEHEIERRARPTPSHTRSESGPRVHFAKGLGWGSLSARRGSVAAIPRPRSASLHTSAGQKTPARVQTIGSDDMTEDQRVVKKRCVGRRKSFVALKEDEEAKPAQPARIGGWTYESAISSMDRTPARGNMRRRGMTISGCA